MKASDLFPGAWVRWNVKDNSGKPIQTTEMVVEINRANAYSLGCTVPTPLEDLEPIPLTPEILEKWCGFSVVDENRIYYVIEFDHPYPLFRERGEKDNIALYSMEGHPHPVNGFLHGTTPIEYLHQLQRLYHARAGEPLKVER